MYFILFVVCFWILFFLTNYAIQFSLLFQCSRTWHSFMLFINLAFVVNSVCKMVAQFSRKSSKDLWLNWIEILFQENSNRFSAAMNLILNHLTINSKGLRVSKHVPNMIQFKIFLSFCYFFKKTISKIFSWYIFHHHQSHWFQVATSSVAPYSFLWILQ